MASLTDGALTVAQIIFVNMVLSGDNALVIALTAQRLPLALRRRAVLLGSGLAVLLQVAFSIVVGWLLDVPGLRLAGAVALILIVRKLVAEADAEAEESREIRGVFGAVAAILFANLAMSFDNVLAVGALSQGMPALTVLGLAVSAVMLLAASSLVMALIERFPWVNVAGAALLAFTAAGMICEEPLLAGGSPAGPRETFADVTSPLPPAKTTTVVEDADRRQLVLASTTSTMTDPISARWSVMVYGVVFSICFGNLRWWNTLRGFDRVQDPVLEEEPACA